MRVWNAGSEDIYHLYNNLNYIIKAGEKKDISDDLAIFLLSRRNVRGMGLVPLRDDDNISDRYKEARNNMVAWAREKWGDYEKHCEEREAQKLQPLSPHQEILKYKKIIDEYELWEKEGFDVPDDISVKKDNVGKVYMCPHCDKEFNVKVAYFGHLRSHQKEKEVNVQPSVVTDTGKRES